jgi:hypothetical protein
MNTRILLNCRDELQARIALAQAAIATLNQILEDQSDLPTIPELESGKQREHPSHSVPSLPSSVRARKSSLRAGSLPAILEKLLRKMHQPFTAKELRAAIRKTNPDLNLGNLSRKLSLAVEQGRLLHGPDGNYTTLDHDALTSAPPNGPKSQPQPPAGRVTKLAGWSREEFKTKLRAIVATLAPPFDATTICRASEACYPELASRFTRDNINHHLERWREEGQLKLEEKGRGRAPSQWSRTAKFKVEKAEQIQPAASEKEKSWQNLRAGIHIPRDPTEPEPEAA